MQALREELQRQRTSLLTANADNDVQKAVQDVEQVKEMEDKVVRYSNGFGTIDLCVWSKIIWY